MNKLIAGIISIFLLCSCKTEFHDVHSYIDYAVIQQTLGVYVTESNSVSFDYEPLGSIYVEQSSGHKAYKVMVTKTVQDYNYQDVTRVYEQTKYGDYILATPQLAIQRAAQIARDKGGNGIINLKYQSILDNEKRVIIVTGMVIKK